MLDDYTDKKKNTGIKKGALNPKCESKRDSIKRDLIQIVELTMKATYKLLYSVIFRPM